ncbi:MAG: hypothetical protein ACNI3C_09055 [Candidatus Marinarcus sp.]|uniref:hypothetical protein n=1 Tax=Candidatus Marinarcus sp. TaxID=3100987 RepID=UPI003B00AE66
MKLKYAGPKPIISEHGVSFKDGKEDKYVYLIIAVQILQAIDHEKYTQNHYSYDSTTQRISDEDMLAIIHKYHPDLEEIMNKELDGYLIHLTNEIEDVKNSTLLNTQEKDVFVKNLEIMKEYKIQRAKNKIFYMHCINTIVEVIKRRKIKMIETPFYEKFWHTLQTIEGHLATSKSGLLSELKIKHDNDKLDAQLIIKNNY